MFKTCFFSSKLHVPSVDVWLYDMITKCQRQILFRRWNKPSNVSWRGGGCTTEQLQPELHFIFIAERKKVSPHQLRWYQAVSTLRYRERYSLENLICSLINRWSVFLFGFFILLPSISFSLFVFLVRDFVAQFTESLCLQRKEITFCHFHSVPFIGNTELSFVTTNGSTNSI